MVINGGSAFDDQNTMVFKNEPFADGGTMVVNGVDKIGYYKSFKVAFLLVSSIAIPTFYVHRVQLGDNGDKRVEREHNEAIWHRTWTRSLQVHLLPVWLAEYREYY